MHINQIELCGNVGKVDIFEAKGKKPFAKVTLATNKRYTRNGEQQEKTSWHTILFFGESVNSVKENISKGCLLSVIGYLDYQQWQTKEGQKRVTTVIVAQSHSVKQFDKKPNTVPYDPADVDFNEAPY